ncbi:hypothetical protein ACOME3_008232 [Neoechinorhynchus agilis]
MFLRSKESHKTDFIHRLSQLINDHQTSNDVKSKALTALRWLLDHNDNAICEFMNNSDNVRTVCRSVDSKSQDLHSKAARLICVLGSKYAEALVEAGMLPSLVNNYVSEQWHRDKQDLIEAIGLLVGNDLVTNQAAVDYCLKKKVAEKIRETQERVPDREAAQEELESGNKLIELLERKKDCTVTKE